MTVTGGSVGEGNGGSGLGGVDGGVDGASVELSGVDIGRDEGLELRLAGRGRVGQYARISIFRRSKRRKKAMLKIHSFFFLVIVPPYH